VTAWCCRSGFVVAGPAAETRRSHRTAIAAKISAAARYARLTCAATIGSPGNGNLNSQRMPNKFDLVRIVAPHASSHPVQVLVHFLGEHSPKQRWTKSRHYPQHCVSMDRLCCRGGQTLVQEVALHLRLFRTPPLYARRAPEKAYLEVIAGMTKTEIIQATDVG